VNHDHGDVGNNPGVETSHKDEKEEEPTTSSYGFALPEESHELYQGIFAKLEAAIGACKTVHQELLQQKHQQTSSSSSSRKRILGPSRPPPDASQTTSAFDSLPPESESSDDDDGPAPLGSIMAKKRLMKGPAPTSKQVKQMAEKRRLEAAGVGANLDAGGREEWMLQPGEHDFLKGVMAKGMTNRTFRNEKHKDKSSAAADDEPLDPSIQKELDRVAKLHRESRGPSLVEQFRQQKAEEKAENEASGKGNGKGKGWSWNRDEHLDSGRRVDKSHLHMVMGGASTELKSKFQGSYSKGFT